MADLRSLMESVSGKHEEFQSAKQGYSLAKSAHDLALSSRILARERRLTAIKGLQAQLKELSRES